MWDYTPKVMDHFTNPRNVGYIKDADGIGEVGSLACGDALTLTFKLDDQGRIEDAKFKTFGCASAVASSSVLTEMIKGMTLEEAANVTNNDIVEKLGGLPAQKMHCSVMGAEALEAAIENYNSKNTGGHQAPQPESRIVCACFGVTEKEIERVVSQNNLETVEDVTNYCKAGGGCGKCKPDIQKIIDSIQGSAQEEPVKVEKTKKPEKLTNIKKIQLIEQTIQEQIRPALRAHGGDIELIDVLGDRVIVAFRGMCAKCKVSQFTMQQVVEAKLREFVSDEITVEEDPSSSHHEHTGE
jgi:NifU-like protein